MEPKSIAFLRRSISSANGPNIEVSAEFLKFVLIESEIFLARHPLDLLTDDFNRDLSRLGDYLGVNFIMGYHGVYRVTPKAAPPKTPSPDATPAPLADSPGDSTTL